MTILDKLKDNACTECPLARTRTNIVIGRGAEHHVKTLIIGEAPGEAEDLSGLPFQGQSGALLDAVIKPYMGTVYITNVVKCRPPSNRNPNSAELKACTPYLDAQIEKYAPDRIITLGRVPFTQLFKKVEKRPLKSFIGSRPHLYKFKGKLIPVFPVYHPAYILRNRSQTDSWKENLKEALNE